MANGGLFQLEARDRKMCQPRVYAYYFKQWNGFQMPFHRHESTEIMYVISGRCRVEMELESIGLKNGEFVVVGQGVSHRLLVDGSCRMLNVEFGFVAEKGESPVFFEWADDEPAFDSLLRSSSPYLVLRDPDEVYHTLKSLAVELDNKGLQGSGLSRMLLVQLLIRIARLREETDAAGPGQEDIYVRQTLHFLRQNYDHDIQVKDAAAAVNLHPGYLQRIFKSVTGSTLVETLTSIRMEKAKMLLHQTNIPVTEIYDYVGVGSRQYFHALFKKHTGLTPLEYRETAGTQVWEYSAK